MSSTAANPSSTSTASCITATPDSYGYVPIDDCRNLWPYYPSFAAALLFAILFGVSTVVHIFQATIYRKRFCWVIIMAGLWETAGFILRTMATHDQLNMGLFTPEEILILLAPLWVNAFQYMILGRMIHYFLPEQKLFGISASRFAKYFVCLDIIAFIVQGAGGSITSGGPDESPDTIMLGIHIYMGGIGLQELFILIFISVAIVFHRRMVVLEREGGLIGKPNWKPLLYALYVTLSLITVRIVFRLVQYSAGVDSSIPTHEVYIYVFEAVPMFFAICLTNFMHPGRWLVGPESEFPRMSRKEKKEEKRRKKEAKKAAKEERKTRKRGWPAKIEENSRQELELELEGQRRLIARDTYGFP